MKITGSLLLVLAFLSVAATTNKSAKKAAEKLTPESLPAGYALLNKLLSDEKDVSKLLIVKKETSELHKVIKNVSEVAGKAHKGLEKEAKRAGINLDDERLPRAEVAARESISKEKEKQLLGAKGDEFEFDLLLTQHEALTYGIHLARVLANIESDSARKELLTKTADDFEQLRDQVFALLRRR